MAEELFLILKELRKGILSPGAKIPVFCLSVFIALAMPSTTQASSLSAKEARKLIGRLAGFNLKNGAIHVKRVSAAGASTVEAAAEIEMAFRLEQNDQAQWRVAEVRSGQDGWEEIALILQAVKSELDATSCDAPDLAHTKTSATDLSVKQARCLLANLLGIQLPSDAVRIKSVSPFGLPLASHQSALIEARIEAEFRFTKAKSSWRVNGVRTGTRSWADPDDILIQVNRLKVARAEAELRSIAKALEDFRGKRGFYVETKSEAVLIDFLSPVYLSRVIRLDPWRRPYRYEGTRDHFSLRSTGPDGKENTIDDIVLNGPTRSTARSTVPKRGSRSDGSPGTARPRTDHRALR